MSATTDVIVGYSIGAAITCIGCLYGKHRRGWESATVIFFTLTWPVVWSFGLLAGVAYLAYRIVGLWGWLLDFPMRWSAVLFGKPVVKGPSYKEYMYEFSGDAYRDREHEAKEEMFKNMREQRRLHQEAEDVRILREIDASHARIGVLRRSREIHQQAINTVKKEGKN